MRSTVPRLDGHTVSVIGEGMHDRAWDDDCAPDSHAVPVRAIRSTHGAGSAVSVAVNVAAPGELDAALSRNTDG